MSNWVNVKRDANHGEIVQALRAAGVVVIDMAAVGGGFPDLVCLNYGRTTLIEVKTATGKLTVEQVKFWADFRGRGAICTTAEQAIKKCLEGRE